MRKYPFIPEPTIALACALNDGEISKVSSTMCNIYIGFLFVLSECGEDSTLR